MSAGPDNSGNSRVVITGLGIVSPMGIGVDAHWAARCEGACAIDRISLFDPGDFDVQVAAEVKGFDPKKMVPQRKAIKVMARDIQLATAAARLAGESGGIEPGSVSATRLGVVLGAGLITSDVSELADAVIASRNEEGRYDPHLFGDRGREAMFPLWLLKHLPNMPASHISIFFDAQGPNNSITTQCVAGMQAIAEATHIIQRGDADVMITGGVDSRIKPLNLIKAHGFGMLALGPEARCRPYDVGRSGMVIGEAAAILVIERLDHALGRGATIFAEVLGSGSSAGRFRVLAPAPGVPFGTGAMRMALQAADLQPQQIAAIFGQGIGHVVSDAAEAASLHEMFGDCLGDIPVVSASGAVGHTWAAAGAVSATDAALSLRHGILPPTAGCETPDPELRLNVLTGNARSLEGDTIMLNAHAFGGQEACLILGRWRPEKET